MIIKKRIATRKDVKALSVCLTGDYKTVDYGKAWDMLIDCCKQKGCENCADAEYMSMYMDDPQTTPAEKCRVEVCISVPALNSIQSSGAVRSITIEGGKFMVFLYKGPYTRISQAYGEIYGHLLNECGVTVLNKPIFEKYLNDVAFTAPEELLTEIWIPIA